MTSPKVDSALVAARLATQVSAVVSRVLNAVGADHGLPELRWDLTARTGPSVDIGCSFDLERAELLAIALTDAATAAAWATVLGLQEVPLGRQARSLLYEGAVGEWRLWLYGLDGAV